MKTIAEKAREQFLAERATCVGGSDVHHLVQLAPYGCTRRLWYDKKGITPDFPFTGNPATERGTACEGFAAADFTREHPDVSLREGPPFRTMPGHRWIGVHADRLVYDDPDLEPTGLLEIECPGARNYYAHKNSIEPPNHKKLQAIWGAGIWEVDRAYVQWFSSDAWRSRFWEIDMAAERRTFEDLQSLATDFWGTLRGSVPGDEPPYERLGEGDRRCESCPFRKRCKGLDAAAEAFLEVEMGMAPLVLGCGEAEADKLLLDYVATKKLKDDAEAAHNMARLQLASQFPGPGRVVLPSGKVSLTVVNKKGYQPKYVNPTTYPLLRVTPNKIEETGDVEISQD